MEAIDKLNRRIKQLERRIDFILTGFLALVLIGLVAPLVLLAMGPDALHRIPNFRQSTPTPKTQPHAPENPAPSGSNAPASSGVGMPATITPTQFKGGSETSKNGGNVDDSSAARNAASKKASNH